MFNAPRAGQRYGTQPGFGGLGASYVDENPLANSVYDDVDPWSAAPTPPPPPMPRQSQSAGSGAANTNGAGTGALGSVLGDATPPAIYHTAFAAVASNDGMAEEASVNALSRVLNTSSLPATVVDKIVNMVSSRPRVSKHEFFVALALAALAQRGKDVSVEQVASLASQNELPEPSLDLLRLQPSTSTFTYPNRQNSTQYGSRPPAAPPAPSYSQDDVWNTTGRTGYDAGGDFASGPTTSPVDYTARATGAGAGGSLAGTGLPKDWWSKQKPCKVRLLGAQGFILNRYMVYEITTERGTVTRRYSEFVFLWDCLVKRYPFRLFPALPPKRVAADEHFLEQRRRGLQRSLTFIINHPIISVDGLLHVFLTDKSFENWRKNTPISLDEESTSKKVDRVEEMSIPSDLEDKVASIRTRLPHLIDQWQRICVLAERIIKRREAAAVRIPSSSSPSALFRLPTHLSSPFGFLSSSASLPNTPRSPRSPGYAPSVMSDSTILSRSTANHPAMGYSTYLPNSPLSFSSPTLPTLSSILSSDDQSDLSRVTNILRAVNEVNGQCWRGDDCELSGGVRFGIEQVAAHLGRAAEVAEARTQALMDSTLESVKTQRDLYLATRDLFIRHDRLSVDTVDKLKKRADLNSVKLDGIRTAAKEGWQDEAEKLTSAIEKDKATIVAMLSRRVFVRACLWHELRVVLHNRENALLSIAAQKFAREEHEYAEHTANNWMSLGDSVENMPFE